MKKILILLLLLNFNFTYSYSIEADVFVQSTVNRAAETLGGGLTIDERMDKLKKIALDTVDIRGIGFYTLGKNRKNISDSQKNEYTELFEKYFLKTFSDRLAEYTDPKVEVKSFNKINEKYTIVSSILIATDKRPEVKIDWRIYTKNPDKPLIRDLIIEGLSLARTQKEEFNSIIQSNDGDINALFTSLKKFINTN